MVSAKQTPILTASYGVGSNRTTSASGLCRELSSRVGTEPHPIPLHLLRDAQALIGGLDKQRGGEANHRHAPCAFRRYTTQ